MIDESLASRIVVGFDAAEVGHVGNTVELFADGRVDPRMTVPVDVAPQAARAIQMRRPSTSKMYSPRRVPGSAAHIRPSA